MGHGLSIFEKRHKYVENDFISEILLRYVVNGLSILKTALLCLKLVRNLAIGLNMLEMTSRGTPCSRRVCHGRDRVPGGITGQGRSEPQPTRL